MYPVLNLNYVLLRQYKGAIIYPVFTENTGKYLSSMYTYERVNREAGMVLELCDGSNTIEEIAHRFSATYNIRYEEVYSNIRNFIEQAEKKGYVYFEKNLQRREINITGNYNAIYPFNAQIELTKGCPLKCIHCFNDSGKVRTKELSTEQIKVILDKLADMGVKKIMLTGGEPTSRKDFTQIVEYASKIFMAISIASNGYFITPKIAGELGKCKNIVVQISLDGTPEHHNLIRGVKDSHKRAIDAIKYLVENRIPVIISTTFNYINWNDMDYVTRLAKGLGAKQITYSLTGEMGRAQNGGLLNNLDIKELLKKGAELQAAYTDDTFYVHAGEVNRANETQGKNSCGRGVTQICIRENGDVSPCLLFDFVYGNLLRQSVSDFMSCH